MDKKQRRRQAELDAVKILRQMQKTDNWFTASVAKEVIPMMHSKPTSETTKRRNYATRLAMQLLTKHYEVDSALVEAEQIWAKPPSKRPKQKKNDYQKRLSAFSKLRKAAKRKGATDEEKMLLKTSEYTPKQILKRVKRDSTTWNKRFEAVAKTYEGGFSAALENARDLEFLTPSQFAEKHHLRTLPQDGGNLAPEWDIFTPTGCMDKPIGYYNLKSVFPWISTRELEDNFDYRGHREGGVMYRNGLFDMSDWTLRDIVHDGENMSAHELRATITSKFFGDAYIYVWDDDFSDDGQVLYKSEYESAAEFAPDWLYSLKYRKQGATYDLRQAGIVRDVMEPGPSEDTGRNSGEW